jgi:hypothetical protein
MKMFQISRPCVKKPLKSGGGGDFVPPPTGGWCDGSPPVPTPHPSPPPPTPPPQKKKKHKKKKIPRVQSQDPFTIPLYTDGIHYHNGELLLSGESKKKSSGDMQIRSKTLSTFAMSFWQSVGVLRFVSHLFIKMRKGERK